MALIEKYAFRGDCAVNPNTDGQTVQVIGPCYSCGISQSVQVDADAFEKFKRGMFAQNCFPSLSAAEREFLISGICSTCWDKMFPSEDDDAE